MVVNDIRIPGNLSGPEGLLAAVIATAVRDFTSSHATAGDWASAAEYLGGPVYREHLEMLNLPADLVPAGLEIG